MPAPTMTTSDSRAAFVHDGRAGRERDARRSALQQAAARCIEAHFDDRVRGIRRAACRAVAALRAIRAARCSRANNGVRAMAILPCRSMQENAKAARDGPLPAMHAAEHPARAIAGVVGRRVGRGVVAVDVLPGQLHVADARGEREAGADVQARAVFARGYPARTRRTARRSRVSDTTAAEHTRVPSIRRCARRPRATASECVRRAARCRRLRDTSSTPGRNSRARSARGTRRDATRRRHALRRSSLPSRR